MRKILIFVYSVFIVIMLANYFYYKSLYNKQINFITALLDRQVQIVGLSVDNTNNMFLSDLNQISFSEDLALFFTESSYQTRAVERMKLFFSKYEDFVTGIKLYDKNKQEFTLKRDESSEVWLEQQFILHVQGEIFEMEKLEQSGRRFEYYLPVLKDNNVIGNIVVSVDYEKYFTAMFSVFNLKDYQWQWVISDSGEIIYDNFGNSINYSRLDYLTSALIEGSVANLIHSATISGETRQIISSYYSTQLLQRDLGLVFSAPTDFFQKYIIRNSIFIVCGTLLLVQVIIFIFWSFFRKQISERQRLKESEKMLFKLIDEMPVGVVIHNKDREIIKANRVAATQYSYASEAEMTGKIFPQTSLPDVSEYFTKNLGSAFNPDQFIIIKKEIGEMILFRNSIPVVFLGEEADMEILIDVTMLEAARKQEAQANVAKTEFLARMSFEIRTPLNGIIGMTDVLSKFNLSSEIKEIIIVLRRSTEVLLNIINDILDFSRIETGKMILDEIPFNLRDEINYCNDLAKTYIADNDVIFSCTIDDNVPESVIADPYRLRQILTNLINHSAKNTEKGEIRLHCRKENIRDGIIILGFDLLDTGYYFDKPSLKKIFGDMVNIESKVVDNTDESGFGTILAKQLIEMMGGTLIAESPSGIIADRGTKISFTIQVYSNERLVKNLDQTEIARFDQIKTLVITGIQNRDEEILSALHKVGLNISVTSFLKSTVAQIYANLGNSSDRYRLVVICDDKDFNGFDAAKIIWDNNLSSRLIMIMISSNDREGNYLQCLNLGIDHYIAKPFDISELILALKTSFPNSGKNSGAEDISNTKKDICILIVEDNRMNQKVIGKMLDTLGYAYDIAEDGYEGYLKAKEKKYDLILMDLIMPEMNGFDSAQRITVIDKSVLIVGITADNMPESRKKAELSGIKEFIPKPVRIDDLIKIFNKYFSIY